MSLSPAIEKKDSVHIFKLKERVIVLFKLRQKSVIVEITLFSLFLYLLL
jgi:hypothetical protein